MAGHLVQLKAVCSDMVLSFCRLYYDYSPCCASDPFLTSRVLRSANAIIHTCTTCKGHINVATQSTRVLFITRHSSHMLSTQQSATYILMPLQEWTALVQPILHQDQHAPVSWGQQQGSLK